MEAQYCPACLGTGIKSANDMADMIVKGDAHNFDMVCGPCNGEGVIIPRLVDSVWIADEAE